MNHVHWIAPVIFLLLIDAVNYVIYMTTIDYMIACYGLYSAFVIGVALTTRIPVCIIRFIPDDV